MEVGKQTALGNFIDLVLRVDSADEMQIQSGQNYGAPYLQISGVDMDGAEVGPLRFWNHERDDVQLGNIYILRGLKVVNEKHWDGEKYVNDRDGAKKWDCDGRTAFEDVTDHEDIQVYFGA